MDTIVYTGQCPHCLEKLNWGETQTQSRAVPERCWYCFEVFTEAERELLRGQGDPSIGGASFDLPGEA